MPNNPYNPLTTSISGLMSSLMQSANNLYGSLGASISKLHEFELSAANDKERLHDFTAFLYERSSTITLFEKAAEELRQWLDDYDFAQGYDFRNKKQHIDTLSSLIQSLEEMSKAETALKGYPDMYGLAEARRKSESLVLECKKKMGLDDGNTYIKKVQACTQELTNVKSKFIAEAEALAKVIAKKIAAIKKVIGDKQIQPLLNKYVAYSKKLKEYAKSCPHEEQDDLKIITEAIASLQKFDTKLNTVKNGIDEVTTYSNNHKKFSNKNNQEIENVSSMFREISEKAYSEMTSDNMDDHKASLDKLTILLENLQNEKDEDEKYRALLKNILISTGIILLGIVVFAFTVVFP